MESPCVRRQAASRKVPAVLGEGRRPAGTGKVINTLRRVGAGGAVLILILSLACADGATRIYDTRESKGERPLKPRITVPAENLSPGAPWAGVVSHHLLADELLDRWFSALARMRPVRTFFVLSPSHWGLSTEEFSLTDGSWLVSKGTVKSDRRAVNRLADRLGVSPEPAVFDEEHGVSTLMPYIHRYFPDARVVALCYAGEPPVSIPKARKLTAALAPEFGETQKTDNFLLVSSDFSHHGDLASTKAKDELSMRFFQNPSMENWMLAGCDNRPGLYVLASLSGTSSAEGTSIDVTSVNVLFQSNSFELSGMGENDITSYFFAFFR